MVIIALLKQQILWWPKTFAQYSMYIQGLYIKQGRRCTNYTNLDKYFCNQLRVFFMPKCMLNSVLICHICSA